MTGPDDRSIGEGGPGAPAPEPASAADTAAVDTAAVDTAPTGAGPSASNGAPPTSVPRPRERQRPEASQSANPEPPVAGSDGVPDRRADQGAEPQPDQQGGVASVPRVTRVLAVANQKGGVGKTTTAVNLSAALAEMGHRVLLVDLDPQANATTGVGVDPRAQERSTYDVLLADVPLREVIVPTPTERLDVVPSSLDLAGAEIELVSAFSRESKLRTALEPVLADYDVVLVDCPPSLGLLTINGLTAAREVLVPIQCEYYALEGLGQLVQNVELVRRNLNPGLVVSTIVLVMYDLRTKLAEEVAREVRAHFPEQVCRTVIPRNVRLSEAPSYGQPITQFDPMSRGAIAYRDLAKEVSDGSS